ncbi:hypothetical protein QTO34_008059 [Cnephaeus nilssonii]|uniref:Uncharacterized protein n=1 Tax=Cnephaeus nilssonii TaxID=3371016 RepID=A0AA40IAP1_CNENI|nr:hypothetical protein QTO34_008059 [Eptesicus nilssonii]
MAICLHLSYKRAELASAVLINSSTLSIPHKVHGVPANLQHWSFHKLALLTSHPYSKNIQRSNADHKSPEQGQASGEEEPTSPPGTPTSPPAKISAGIPCLWEWPSLGQTSIQKNKDSLIMPELGTASAPLHTTPHPSLPTRPHLHQGFNQASGLCPTEGTCEVPPPPAQPPNCVPLVSSLAHTSEAVAEPYRKPIPLSLGFIQRKLHPPGQSLTDEPSQPLPLITARAGQGTLEASLEGSGSSLY